MEKDKVNIAAEIGCNHMGNFDIALDMIKLAKEYCKVDIVKFQKRHLKEIELTKNSRLPHPNEKNSFGDSYKEHREFLEFDIGQHMELKKYAESLDLIYSCSVWGIESAKEIISLKPKFIKIPSALNLNFPLLEFLCESYRGDIHLSLGMTKKEEETKIIKIFKKNNKLKNLVLYACTSGYPVKFEEVYLGEIKRLRSKYIREVKGIGFSGHHLGIAIDIAAITLGANWIERHFTLDRTWKGTDQVASLEPDGMRKLVRDTINVQKSFEYKPKKLIETELITRDKLKVIIKN